MDTDYDIIAGYNSIPFQSDNKAGQSDLLDYTY